jgi:hypothetical protein
MMRPRRGAAAALQRRFWARANWLLWSSRSAPRRSHRRAAPAHAAPPAAAASVVASAARPVPAAPLPVPAPAPPAPPAPAQRRRLSVTAAERAAVERLWARRDAGVVVTGSQNLQLTARDFRTLRGSTWLNDEARFARSTSLRVFACVCLRLHPRVRCCRSCRL